MLHATASRPNLDDPDLAAQWRGLAAGASPFLSWEWTFCLAAERYDDPVLISTRWDGVLVGLALFNRRRSRFVTSLYLHETGDPEWDASYIEHNGVVAAPEHQHAVLAATLGCAQRLATRVILHGVPGAALQLARQSGDLMDRLNSQAAPFLQMAPGGSFLPLLSRNARAQLRRSDRHYTERGPIGVRRAENVEQGSAWLSEMLDLHAATWSKRGISSGFLSPRVQRFHQALLGRGVPTGVVDLLRVTAGPELVGYLLNLTGSGRTMHYQSGFDYGRAGPHGKPGLTCHAAAIGRAWSQGLTEYDFLAGDRRYKRSLSNSSRELHWLELCRPLSLAGIEATGRRLLRR